MSRLVKKLNPRWVKNVSKLGLYADGLNNLYLQVKPGSKSWIFRYKQRDESRKEGFRSRSMGLGSIEILSLSEARTKARFCKKLLFDGIDPIEYRNKWRKNGQNKTRI